MAVQIESGHTDTCARTLPFPVSVPVGFDSPLLVPATDRPAIEPEVVDEGPTPIGRSMVRRFARAIATAAVIAICAVFALPVLGLAFGYRTYVVTSGSMSPHAQAGDAVLLKELSTKAIRVGDVIAFHPLRSKGSTMHRVIDIRTVSGKVHFRTQGDANTTPDPDLAPAGNVLGRVDARLPGLGRALIFATERTGRMLLVVAPALLLVLREVWLLSGRRKRASGRVPRSRTTLRRSLAASALVFVAVLGLTVPAAARFTDGSAVGTNTLGTGQVDPPNLTSAVADLLLICRITLAWTPPATGLAPDGYDVYRSTTNGGPYSFVKHVGNVTTTTDTSLSPSTTYFYVLKSTRSSWTSTNSNQRSATSAFLLCL